MSVTESSSQLPDSIGTELPNRAEIPIEVCNRAKREREFFNRYTEADKIPDELLLVPAAFDVPPEIDRLKPLLQGKTVCDYGCGYGLSAAYFGLQGAMTYAFDVADTNIRVAQRSAHVNGVEKRVFLQVMQGECLGFPDNFFDLVYGNAVLHRVELALAAREIYRVLKPDGLAIFAEPLGENELLEWARHCPLRSAAHSHSEDEKSFLYSDIETLRAVFDHLTFRETGILTLIKSVFRKVEVGRIAQPRWERLLPYLARADNSILAHFPLTSHTTSGFLRGRLHA